MKLVNLREEILAADVVFGFNHKPNKIVVQRPIPQKQIHPYTLCTAWITKRIANGIENAGSTCFIASTIQCLQHVPAWKNYLLEQHPSMCIEASGKCVVCKLKRLSEACFTGNSAASPREISLNIASIGPDMRPFRQEDAHEFLTSLFDKIQKNLIHGMGKLDSATEMTTALGKVFGGYLKNQTVCLSCYETSNNYEEFLNISLDINKASSIEEALSSFVAPETMDYSEWYSCEKCSKKRQAEKRCFIDALPNCLIVHLKRYSYFPTPKKINDHVKFDERIDLNKFVSHELRNQDCTYLLSSIIVHQGISLNSGHYSSYVSDPSDKSSTRQWHRMNDSIVGKTSWDAVASQNAYMLYYVKTSTCWSLSDI